MPKKRPLGRTGNKHRKVKVDDGEGSSSKAPVVELDMEPEEDSVEGVLADLIDQVELDMEAWLLQREELHRRQWREFEDTVAQHNRCGYTCRRLPREQYWRVFSCTERECELVASKMLRSNPYRQRYLTCAECAESCWTFGECECDLPHVRCTDCGEYTPRGAYGMWHPGDCECPLNMARVHGLITCPWIFANA